MTRSKKEIQDAAALLGDRYNSIRGTGKFGTFHVSTHIEAPRIAEEAWSFPRGEDEK